MKLKNKSGFTLIELLVVVFIIGILLSAFQIRMIRSFNNNTLQRAADIAFTLVKLAKHLSVLENRDMVFGMYNKGNADPSNAAWTSSHADVYRYFTPFDHNDADFTTTNFLNLVNAGTWKKTSFTRALPTGACFDADLTEGNQTQTNPSRTIFKFYGPCQGANSTDLGKYHIGIHEWRVNGITTTAGNEKYFMTVEIGGGNFSGAPFLITKGDF